MPYPLDYGGYINKRNAITVILRLKFLCLAQVLIRREFHRIHRFQAEAYVI